MNFPERRHLERVTPERLVYVDLKPDNGGIVLNLSHGGLCFQSVAPVRKHQSFRFSLDEHSVAACGVGEVVWTDDSRKFAGLRFTQVSAEVDDELKEITKPAAGHTEERTAALPVLSDGFDGASLATSLVPLDVEKASALQVALLREANVLPEVKLSKAPRRRYRALSRAAVVVLAVYAIWATVALCRHSQPSAAPIPAGGRSQSAVQAYPAEESVIAKPAAAISASHSNKPRIRRTALPEPERPLLRTAPVRFEYPVISSGSPSGRVDLRLLISATGSVQDVQVLAGNANLANAGASAARRWRYRPLERDGRPVEAEAHVSISFAGNEAVNINFRK